MLILNHLHSEQVEVVLMFYLKSCLKILILASLCCGCDLKFQATTNVILDEQAIQLTKDERPKSDPAWSPDGSMIAYSCYGTATSLVTRALSGEELGKIGRIEDNIRNTKFDLSPDGANLVYNSNTRGHLWVVNLQSGTEFLLTPQHPSAREPAWSPDGQWIAFTAPESNSGNRSVWIIDVEGGGVRKVTSSNGRDLLPAWSPDNKRIAYESSSDNKDGIWVVNIDTAEATQLTPDSTFNSAPDWSPDGLTIAYHSNRNGRTDIWTIPAAGGLETQLTNSVNAVSPAWSPDGSKIAYRTSAGVWISSSSGEVLNRTNIFEIFPLWFPDSQTLLGAISIGFSTIQVFLLADSLLIPLTQAVDEKFDFGLEWYPDSKKIMFVRRNPKAFAGQTLWTKSIIGGVANPLMGDGTRNGAEYNPAISPDGRWLVYDDGSRLFLVQLSDGAIVDLSPFIGNGLSEADWAPNSQGIVCNNRTSLKIFSTDSSLVVEERVIPGRFTSPAWSAPHPVFGSNIAAIGSGGIFVMRPDGSNPQHVISGGRYPSWSPDGTRLAFIKDNQLFVLPIFVALKN